MTCVGRWGRGGAVPSSDPCDPLALLLCKFFLIEMPASLAVIPEKIEIAELTAPTSILSLALKSFSTVAGV